jgi:predicted nucleic acid-binding Zn ribbon protein
MATIVELTQGCPACGDPLPPYKGHGRRPEWCSTGCRSLASRERRRAAELRVYSRRLLELAEAIERGKRHGFGSAESQRRRSAEVRAIADAIDAQFSKGTATSGITASSIDSRFATHSSSCDRAAAAELVRLVRQTFPGLSH